MNQSPIGEEIIKQPLNNTDVNWKIDYNAQNKYIGLEITKNNKTQHLKFDKDDISKLLSNRSVNASIHKRLINDNYSLLPSSALTQYNVGDEGTTIKKLENELDHLYKNKTAIMDADETPNHTTSEIELFNPSQNKLTKYNNVPSFKTLTKKVRIQQTKKRSPRKRLPSKRSPRKRSPRKRSSCKPKYKKQPLSCPPNNARINDQPTYVTNFSFTK